ncbi:hypothetical protein Tco_0174864 [Tanacetum coccineum]
MAHQQPQQIISIDLLVPPNKQCDVAEAKKKIVLINPTCPPSSRILGDILRQHPLFFSLIASALEENRRKRQLGHEDYDVGTHTTPSAPRSPNPVEQQGESSAPKRSLIFSILNRMQPDLETPILTAAEIDVGNLDEATQMSITIARSLEHLVDEETKKIVEGNDDVDENRFVDDTLNSQEDPYIREEESAEDALRRKKGKGIAEIKDTPPPQPLDPLGLILILYLRIRKNSRN